MASSLATRCPACGTVFRVVPDQLRVSEGWVRCGRCANVFNASASLVDMETGAPRPPLEGMVERATSPTVTSLEEPADSTAHFDLDLQGPTPSGAPRHDAAGAQLAPGAHDDPPFGDEPGPVSERSTTADELAATPAVTSELPSFVRQADRAARWQQPRVRTALFVGLVLGVLTLAGQLMHEYRDFVAARFPTTRPALEQTCQWLGCTVGAARSIEGLAVESSGLVRVEQSSIYKLTVALRNRTALELALPAVELSLTDSQGKLLARRVLRSAELGASQNALTAGRDLALQATIQTGPDVVAGYTIELFYP
jgi:predicted Zn finger-like uncharacterized protein